ncbi:MAG: multiprotein bridging factor aMBF1 [Candidatus Jordarchaeaceae archaeon]
MLCEVCGKKIIGKPKNVNIEGAELTVCENCVKFGDSLKDLSVTSKGSKTILVSPKKVIRVKRPRAKLDSKDFFLDEDLVEDYAYKIRRAREGKGLSHEELAKKINERVTIIKKIETGKMQPSLALVKKLEKELQINLTEKSDSKIMTTTSKDQSKELTLGDIIKIKKKSSNNA